MPQATASKHLAIQGSISGSTFTASGNFDARSGAFSVDDADGDGRADTGDWFGGSSNVYTGFAIEIGGRFYAIFQNGTSTEYFIPYFPTVAEIDTLGGTSTSGYSIVQLGDDAAVTNMDGTDVPSCFVGGTWIATPNGETRVEELKTGDAILCAKGKTQRIRWIGRQSITSLANVTRDERLAPVCIQAGALGNHSDLYVSADHGMVVDGLVINAAALVNGDTVRFVPATELPEQFTYYHIETEAHDVILANGAPSETFIDMAGRSAFDNYQEYLGLYGADRLIMEMNRPRIASARLVPQNVKDRLGRGREGPERDRSDRHVA